MKARLTRLTYSLATLAAPGRRLGRRLQVVLTQGGSMKERMTRLAYSLATLVTLAAALGAGHKWR